MIGDFKPRVASMFAGIGGICLGFMQAGFDIVWANEINTFACQTYRTNFGGEHLVESDIKTIDYATIPDFNILTAGFPCQSFSIGGKQEGFDDNRGRLFFEIAKVIEKKRPQYVFLENVENLIEHDNGKTFNVIHNILAQYGYIIKYKIMSSIEYGNVPQNRKRIYIVAFKEHRDCKNFSFPEPLPLTYSVFDFIDRTERKSDLYYFDKDSTFYRVFDAFIRNSKAIFRVYNGQIRNVRMPNVCPTLTASMNSLSNAVILRDNYGIRRLTHRECLALQGFPKEYSFPKVISSKEAYHQIGNSVTVPVIKRIAEKMLQVIHKNFVEI